jgi:hypothetical protein
MMDTEKNTAGSANPRWVRGLIISAIIIALGVIASVLLREAGRPAMVALIVAVAFNLAGALVMEYYSRRDGVVLGSMALLMLLGALPLLWVADKTAWMRENPLTFGFIIVLAGYMRLNYNRNWPVYVVAIILGAAHVLISFPSNLPFFQEIFP